MNRICAIVICLLFFFAALPVIAQEARNDVTLSQLERMALENNPTIAQATAAIAAADGRKKQAGLYPNPTVGVQLEELSQRDPLGHKDEHIFFFAEQTVLLGGKRGKARELFEQEKQQAQTGLEAQKLRVLNGLRVLYYRTLGAQKELQVRKNLLQLAEEAAGITKELHNVGQADQPDVLEAEIEEQSEQLAVLAAEQELEKIWKRLAAVIGKPDLPVAPVAGTLDSLPDIDREKLMETLLMESMQVKVAQLQMQRAEAGLNLAKAQRVPDLRLRGGIGYNYEQLPTTDQSVGLEGFVEVGIPLPLLNQNQGKIAAAKAEAKRAEKELQRVKLALSQEFSATHAEYLKARTAAQKYRTELLPRAQQAYDLYLNSFQQMAAAYPQVLIAQRKRYELEVEYVKAQTNAWTAALQLQGFLLSEGALDAPPFTFSTDENAQVFE